jgi:hypothetical protein
MNFCRGQLVALLGLATFAWPMTAAPFAECMAATVFTGIPDEEDNAKEPTKLESTLAAVHSRPSAEHTRRPRAGSPHRGGRHALSGRLALAAPAPFFDSRTPPLHC